MARGDGQGKLLFLDAFSGVAGDMLLAALVDLGVPFDAITAGLSSLGIAGYRLELGYRRHHSIVGRALRVHVDTPQPQRSYATIKRLIEAAGDLTEGARERALSAFRVLAEAEASVHGTPVADVHFHEVGAVDSIVDTVGSCVALDFLGADVQASPLPLARGFIETQHGRIPLPAPATVLCLAGVPTVDAGSDRELVTPTGAALVKASCRGFARWPAMTTERVGYGAGTRSLADRPNLLRVVLGTPGAAPRGSAHAPQTATAEYAVLEANLDDMSGELLGHALCRLLSAGALDSWYTPIGMKKGRPAVMLCALVRRAQVQELARTLLSETSTLGLRVRPCERIERPRRLVQVQTPFGLIAVKIADGDGLPANIAPEYESCRKAAETHGVSLKTVYTAALAAHPPLLPG